MAQEPAKVSPQDDGLAVWINRVSPGAKVAVLPEGEYVVLVTLELTVRGVAAPFFCTVQVMLVGPQAATVWNWHGIVTLFMHCQAAQ